MRISDWSSDVCSSDLYSVAVNSPAGNAAQDNVQIAASATANYTFVVGTSGSEIVVTGARRNLDFSSTTTGIAIDLQDLTARMPLGRSLTDAALLAPTAPAGDTTFGNLASLGGASVARSAERRVGKECVSTWSSR